MFQYFYNSKLSHEQNSMLFWTWESFIHHLYFIILFLQRQFSDKWDSHIWRVNMEKECEFFKLLFGGDAAFCAEASTTIFAGLWFRTPKPKKEHLIWIGRLITNYQHSEAIIHFLICILAIPIVLTLAQGRNPSRMLRYAFFFALFFETFTMCVPYLFLFGWAWNPFVSIIHHEDGRKLIDPLVATVESLGKTQPFVDGIQFGAALITMFWVSVVVLVLDGIAMWKAWVFAFASDDVRMTLKSGKEQMITFMIFGSSLSLAAAVLIEFFSEGSRGHGVRNGSGHDIAVGMSEWIADSLHGFFGNDNTKMRDLL